MSLFDLPSGHLPKSIQKNPSAKGPRGTIVDLIEGDCVEVMAALIEKGTQIDAVVCDPPYLLDFMGMEFDSQHHAEMGGSVGAKMQAWHLRWTSLAFQLLKPGGYLLAFGGTRTYHRLVCAVEDAGFEVRDQIGWLYGQGFPKSLDVSKAIDKAAKGHPQGSTRGDPDSPNSGKFKTQATEGKRSVNDVGQQFGAGPGQFMRQPGVKYDRDLVAEALPWQGWGTALKPAWEPIVVARKPLEGTVVANALAHGTGALNIDGCRIATDWSNENSVRLGHTEHATGRWPANIIHDGSPEVLALFPEVGLSTGGKGAASGLIDNEHIYGRFSLMQWLTRLVTPPGGVVLDPFMGSGTTGMAALLEGFQFLGIEKEVEYMKIAKARIRSVK